MTKGVNFGGDGDVRRHRCYSSEFYCILDGILENCASHCMWQFHCLQAQPFGASFIGLFLHYFFLTSVDI
jgi:hypothetical protein